MRPRVIVIGLDGLEPAFAFDRFADVMPNLSAMRARGAWGPLRSTTPPITVPAWACMTSGTDPGRLGVYGFRNRRPGGYEMEMATARSIRVPRLWNLLSDAGKRVIVVGVPPTYPPAPVHGEMVSCLLTPPGRPFTHPASLQAEIEKQTGPWKSDVEEFRSGETARIVRDIEHMSDQRFAAAAHLARTRDWDFLMMVDMGGDRLHHALLGTPQWNEVGRRFYARLDAHLGALCALADADTTVLVVSDHGAREMEGVFRINDWLAREGLLVLADRQTTSRAFHPGLVDWKRTTAWAEGGYYARIFVNVRGELPEGTIEPSDRERVVAEIEARLAEAPVANKAHRPESLYDDVQGAAPDLMVFFADLAVRAVGSVGGLDVVGRENDTGPDGANHSWHGVFAMTGPAVRPGRVDGAILQDVTPTVLGALGVDVPKGCLGIPRIGATA